MNLLDELLMRYVAPLMSDAGFRSSGRTYCIVSSHRYMVLVSVRPYGLSDLIAGFHVEWAAIPAAIRDYFKETRPAAKPDITWGLVSGRLVVPSVLRKRSYEATLWTFDADELDAFGSALAEHLRSAVMSKWLSLLNPDELAAALTEPELKTSDFSMPLHPTVRRLIAYVDIGDVSELTQQLNEAEKMLPAEEWIPWLRMRLLEHTL